MTRHTGDETRHANSLRTRTTRFARAAIVTAATLAVAGMAWAADDDLDAESSSVWSETQGWFAENFEVHGFFRTRFYARTANFTHRVSAASWRTELNIEPELRLYSDADWDVSIYAVIRPIYEAINDVHSSTFGGNTKSAAFGTGAAFPDNEDAFRSGAGTALVVPKTGGARISGEFTTVNADTGSLFTAKRIPAVSIDPVVFFGRVTAPRNARGGKQDSIGGAANGTTYRDLRDNFGRLALIEAGIIGRNDPNPLANAGLPVGAGLDASLAMASMPLGTPLNFYAGGLGQDTNFQTSPVDINRNETRLKFDCRDNAHPLCIAREFYIDIDYKNLFLRIGKQQIVWGKTDAFRLQDVINPIDFGYHNVIPDLEERRIPQLSLDAIYSVGTVGPLQDVSLEFAWVFDRFLPDQFGQCGEAYAFTAACEARADAGGHQLFNFSLAQNEQRDWGFDRTQPGLRVEFRTPKPSIAFSLSAFWGYQKLPVARFRNAYSVENPNSAALLFLQGVQDGTGTPLAGIIDTLSSQINSTTVPGAPAPYSGGAPGTGNWITGFDPYDRSGPTPTAGGTLEAANGDLQNAWFALANVLAPADGGCAGLSGVDLRRCGALIAPFGLPWSASEATLEYPRVLSLGASMDYQIPGIDTVLRLEVASDIGRGIQNTSKLSQVSYRDVFKMAIGLDRSTFIPFLNPDRTAFISFQTFLEHIVDYDNGRFGNDGMVPYETNVISTLFTQNYWRNDSLVLQNLVAIDWNAGAVLWAPQFTWVFNQALSFQVGINVFWGSKRHHNIRDLCSDATLGCFGDPTTWQAGNWQTLNAPLKRAAQAPFWAQESFADKFMRNRDEFWVGLTYQF